jgi:hypothetical protein
MRISRALRHLWTHSAAALLIVIVVLSVYGVARSPYFQACLAANPQQYPKVLINCTADFTEHYHGPLTAVATLFLALFTTTLWWATRGLLRHAPKVERGYVFGGCGNQKATVDPKTGKVVSMWVRATHGNYGKTPAFVERIAVEVCLEKDLPPRPIYTHYFDVNEPLIPGIMGLPINRVEHTFPLVNNQIYYGRIFYRDIFEKSHYSSFIYRFDANGGHEPVGTGDTKGMVHADYWKFD